MLLFLQLRSIHLSVMKLPDIYCWYCVVLSLIRHRKGLNVPPITSARLMMFCCSKPQCFCEFDRKGAFLFLPKKEKIKIKEVNVQQNLCSCRHFSYLPPLTVQILTGWKCWCFFFSLFWVGWGGVENEWRGGAKEARKGDIQRGLID